MTNETRHQAAIIRGARDMYFLPAGGSLSGCWCVVGSDSLKPSHDALNSFAKMPGFPTVDGCTVNDRDYESDKHAQEYTRTIARCYDGRAIQEAVIIDASLVVLSGNGRTMAGALAASEGTDGAYIDYLRACCVRYGFTTEDVQQFRHPRLVFMLDEALPYTASTFAMFNRDDKKGMDKTETAIKYGKIIPDTTFNRIISTVNGFETLSEYFSNTEAVTRCVNDLRECGAIEPNRYNVIFDGDGISATGREMIENILTGKIFAASPECVRICTQYKSIRRAAVFALAELANNVRLGSEYSLSSEISSAIRLVSDARKAGYKAGEKVSEYARQTTIFGGTVADYNNTTALYLADMFNGDKYAVLKRFVAIYNREAKDVANGQVSMFGDVCSRSKNDICSDIARMTNEEQERAITEGNEERIRENEFISQSKIGTVAAGGYAKYLTASGESVTVKVEKTDTDFADIVLAGGAKTFVFLSTLRPTAEHLLTLPSWLVAGVVISNGHYCQRIKSVSDKAVSFEWINGGCFVEDIATVVREWQPYSGECQVLEVA